MLSHENVWAAIDALAVQNGLSTSGLARRAGLDPTTFNRSKRVTGDGRLRWPSTESIAKILEATGEELATFASRLETPDLLPRSLERQVPLGQLGDIGTQASFDRTGQPTGGDWSTLKFPSSLASTEFALEVSGDGLLPLYRNGDIIIADSQAALRRGDRILVKQANNGFQVFTLYKRFPEHLDLRTIGDKSQSVSLAHSEIEVTARIIWVSQ